MTIVYSNPFESCDSVLCVIFYDGNSDALLATALELTCFQLPLLCARAVVAPDAGSYQHTELSLQCWGNQDKTNDTEQE